MKTLLMSTLDSMDNIFLVMREEFEAHGPRQIIIQDVEQSRSLDQNRLAFLWYGEAADQLKDESLDDKRAYCKLTIGVPLRRENEEYRKAYDEHVRPLSYETKIACMKEPIDWPVTRDMGVKMMCRYLNGVYDFFTSIGVALSKPEDLYDRAMGLSRNKPGRKT